MKILIAAAAALLLTSCVQYGSRSDISKGQGKIIHNYLQTADHLSKEQKLEMAQRRPFIGMTIEEVGLILHKDSSPANGTGASQADYSNSLGEKYTIFFDGGKPNRVIKILFLSVKELEELRTPRDTSPGSSNPI